MSAVTKKPPTKLSKQHCSVLYVEDSGRVYHIPRNIAEKYEVYKPDKRHKASSEDVFTKLERKYTKPGVLLRGTRHRENLTQAQMAKRINVTQSDLSKMENGKRPIGKTIAKRIEEEFGINYRYFL